MFRLITPQHNLHSRVKESITHNSTVILSSNFNGRLIAMLMGISLLHFYEKCIILFMSYVEFLEYDLKWFAHIINAYNPH